MRKIIFMAALCLVTINISAQNVYKEILRLSKVGAADKTKDLDTRRVYQFKVDELNYMLMKTREQKPDTKMYNSFVKDEKQKEKTTHYQYLQGSHHQQSTLQG